MTKIPYILVLLSISLSIFSQNISVSAFERMPSDMDARVNFPEKDQNGDICAILKIETTQTDFVFEGGSLGIVKTEQKVGEYWVYIPWGSKRITIKHPQLGVLRNYVFPESIDKATVYLMKLTTGKVTVIVEEEEIKSQWLIIKSEPEGANVFIDEELVGTTPFQRKYEEGEYSYRLEKSKYYNSAGKLNLTEDKEIINVTLKPKFGSIKINSQPEDGMLIFLDDENTGLTTPATVEEVSSGEHYIKLQSEWYKPEIQRVNVSDGELANVDFTMQPSFAEVNISTNPSADILIDGNKMANGIWNGRLLSGVYTLKVEKEKYYSQEKQLKITTGQNEELSFELIGKKGNFDIITTPMEAIVYIDGKRKGETPLSIEDILIGEYEIEITKDGHKTVHKTIRIKEGEDLTINETLVPQESENIAINEHIEDNSQNGEEETITINEIEHGSFIDPRDDRNYKTIKIGNQVWMAENLNYKTSSGSWCYDDNSSNCNTYGRLYDWETAKIVCPDGWHLPSKSEFEILLDNFGGEKDAFNALIPSGSSGFSALLGGWRYYNGRDCDNIGLSGYFWSSSLEGSDRAWYMYFYRDYEFVHVDHSLHSSGFSVRCLQD